MEPGLRFSLQNRRASLLASLHLSTLHLLRVPPPQAFRRRLITPAPTCFRRSFTSKSFSDQENSQIKRKYSASVSEKRNTRGFRFVFKSRRKITNVRWRKGAGLPGGRLISERNRQSLTPDSHVDWLACRFNRGGGGRGLLFWSIFKR